ncbi:hypothetical protein AMS68_002569 [Peltaster fructicola]|uniref:Ryanodine receptor Ryr domain-containing protein n=1 Tax=Peltaster fructicola TaxID=286661 RepID=A0A6H0XQK4_9PEZI|nr:hypothetical protein AMS68_002569 [Peltaster fructicola]
MTSSTIFVAGAVTSNSVVYHMPYTSATATQGRQAQMVVRHGGADLVAQLLTAASADLGVQVIAPGRQANGVSHIKHEASTITDLACQLDTSPAGLHYKVIGTRNIAKAEDWQVPHDGHASTSESSSTIVFTGAGDAGDQEVTPALELLQRVKPTRVVYCMTAPLATGSLWDVLRTGPDPARGVPEPDNLAVIVEADDLRAHGINLSQGLSWEATSEDFVRNLGSNGRLDTLVTCPNLIVRFGTEGVIYHRGRDAVDPKLFFDPKHSEGSSLTAATPMIELSSAFTAGFTAGLTATDSPSFDTGIQLGLTAAQRMATIGFIPDPPTMAPQYPTAQIMRDLKAHSRGPAANIPSTKISTGDRWLLLDTLTGDPTEVARQILSNGPERALGRCPTRKYGDLISTERVEIESLGAVTSIIDEHMSTSHFTPTCIGVFGPAGSGKTFTATSIATHLASKTSTTQTIHDSRFLNEDSLAAACHGIRDASARGSLPVVIFKNFESILNSEDGLLATFSTLMSEGTFPDRGTVRNLGHAVMFFLIDQESADPETPFSPTAEMSLKRRGTFQSLGEVKQMRMEDSPLIDLLHGVVKVTGPNCSGAGDRTFAIRRALMLRHIIKEKYPHLEVNGVMNFDDAVLHALLLTPTFKHGLGSLQKIISASRLSNRTKFDVSALPPEEQIQLHVDGRIFMSFLRSPKLPPALREILAQGLFEAYKKQRLLMVKSPEERKQLEREPSFRDWDELPGELKESTRSQADDIPRKLRAISCFMLNDGNSEPRGDPLVAMPEFSEKDLLMLSEMEHERFNAERLQRQWRMGPRNAKQRTTPFLVPWRDLTQEWKDVDSVMVECVPRILERAGWRIYRMKN